MKFTKFILPNFLIILITNSSFIYIVNLYASTNQTTIVHKTNKKAIENKVNFSTDTKLVRTSILRFAPIGSDVELAKQKMESNGFTCEWYKNQEFAGIKGRANYLYCDFSQSDGIWSTRRWQVAIIYLLKKDQKIISEVVVTYGVITL